MNSSVKLGIGFALIWMIVKMTMHLMSIDDKTLYYISIALILLLIPLGIFLGIRNSQKRGNTIFFDDLKEGMKPAAIMVILISVFTFIYYKEMGSSTIEAWKTERNNREIERIEAAGGWDKFVEKNDNQQMKEISYDDYVDKFRDNGELVFAPSSVAVIGLMGWTLVSLFYAFLLTLFYRKILVKFT